LRSSFNWFQLLAPLGTIQQWLENESEERIDQTVILLSIMQQVVPDDVAKLLEPYVGRSEAWCSRLARLVERADLSNGDYFFKFFLRLIDGGILDQSNNGNYGPSFWSKIYSLKKEHPALACKAIGHYLNRHLVLSLANEQPNPFALGSGTLLSSQYEHEFFIECARNAPEKFVSQVLPFMLQVMDLTADREEAPPWKDQVWTRLFKSMASNKGVGK